MKLRMKKESIKSHKLNKENKSYNGCGQFYKQLGANTIKLGKLLL